MQRRSTIQENRMFPSYLIQRIPNNGLFPFDHLFRRADGVNLSQLLQTTDDKRFKQHQCHFLGQSTLVQFELGSDHDDRTSRVIHSFAQQIHTETTCLALQHVREGLEGTISCTRHSTPVTPVIHQGIHRLLQHSLLIPDDHLRSFQLQKIPQTIVTIDHAAI